MTCTSLPSRKKRSTRRERARLDRPNRSRSGEDLANYVAVYVGEAALDAVVVVGEPFVVDTKKVEDRRVEVVDFDRLLGGFPADLVGVSVGEAVLQPGSGQPGGKGLGVVVAAGARFVLR